MLARDPIIVFDTDCVLCSTMVRFVLAFERDRSCRFAGAWSDEGLALAARHGFSRADLNETFLVLIEDAVLTKSEAGIELLRHMRAPWRWFSALQVIPRPVRDAAYSFVARRRYHWFGRRENCTVVPPGESGRFIGVRGKSSTVR